MNLYTIGFTKKTAEHFFNLLKINGVKKIVDIRRRPEGQLAGFAKQADLPYFLDKLIGVKYEHLPEFAPTDEILDAYRESHDWQKFEADFAKLLSKKELPAGFFERMKSDGPYCLLCSEDKADHCHRRLVAEFMQSKEKGIDIVHL